MCKRNLISLMEGYEKKVKALRSCEHFVFLLFRFLLTVAHDAHLRLQCLAQLLLYCSGFSLSIQFHIESLLHET